MKSKTSLSKNRRTAYTIPGFNPSPPPHFNFSASNLNNLCMMLRQINFLYNNNSGQGSTYLYTLDIRELHLAPVDMDVSQGHDLSGRVTSELDQHHHIRTIQVSLDSLLLCWIQTIIHFLQFDQIKYEKMWYSFPSLSAT